MISFVVAQDLKEDFFMLKSTRIRLEDEDESCTGDESWVCGFLIKYLSKILAKE